MSRAPIAVAVSGGGRSLENLLERELDHDAQYRVAAVVTSHRDCRGAQIATDRGLPLFAAAFPRETPEELKTLLESFLSRHQVSWVALAGFIRVFPCLPQWAQHIINIHPSLLPEFGGRGMYGDKVHQAVIAAGVAKSGATIHFVNERYDEGHIIAQIEVPVGPRDGVDSLKSKVFAAEKILYPKVLNQLITGQLPLSDGQVARIEPA